MKQFERCDPAKLEAVRAETQICKAACDRWVDNCWEVESWLKKNNASMTSEMMHEAFPILKDLDYYVYEHGTNQKK